MRFQCQNKECGKLFHYTAKRTNNNPAKQVGTSLLYLDQSATDTMVCPYCLSLDFTESIEPAIAEDRVVSVLVVDLVVGENLALNKALSDGYEITARYAKQFILERKASSKEAIL